MRDGEDSDRSPGQASPWSMPGPVGWTAAQQVWLIALATVLITRLLTNRGSTTPAGA